MRKIFATVALVATVIMSSCSNDNAFESDVDMPVATASKNTLTFSYKGETYKSDYFAESETDFIFDDAKVQVVYDNLLENENLAAYLNEDGSLVYFDSVDELNTAYGFINDEVAEDANGTRVAKGYCKIDFYYWDGCNIIYRNAANFSLSFAKPSGVSLPFVDDVVVYNNGSQLPARITLYTGVNYTGYQMVYAAKPNGGQAHGVLNGVHRNVKSYSCCFYYP